MKCDIVTHTSPTELRFVESHWIEQQKIFLAQECNCEFLNFCPIFSAELNHCTALSFDIHLFALLFLHFTFFALHIFCTAPFFLCSLINCNKLLWRQVSQGSSDSAISSRRLEFGTKLQSAADAHHPMLCVFYKRVGPHLSQGFFGYSRSPHDTFIVPFDIISHVI